MFALPIGGSGEPAAPGVLAAASTPYVEGARGHRAQMVGYVRRLAVTDTLVVLAALAAAEVIRFGVTEDDLLFTSTNIPGRLVLPVLIGAVWLALLSGLKTRETGVVGLGAEEYQRVLRATVGLFAAIAMVSLLAHQSFARGYLAIALPAGLLGLLLSRNLWRRWLAGQRAQGGFLTRVLVVGSPTAAAEMARQFERDASLGYQVVGVCTPGYLGEPNTLTKAGDRAVLAMGSESDVVVAARAVGADSVAVTAGDQITAARMQELAWELSDNGIDLTVSPGVVDVAVPRLNIRPVAGLPLVHVEEPQYKRANRFGKVAFDRVGAAVALVLLSPVFLAVALAVKVGSPGPLFYTATRVGANGREFGMIKFRSMVVDADQKVAALMAQNQGAGVLFKMRDDPRVTPVGKFLRRYSLDELPQLINVLKGEMSLVGPRPPLPREVAQYTGLVDKRLLVRPGVTGLWQVSGRSDLPWDEAVRLDLSYVANWTLMQDLMICWRTVKAVVAKEGAY